MVTQELMEAEVSELIGAGHGERRPQDRVTHRNGYRPRSWDTRPGEIELQIPKIRQGSYFPSFVQPRKRSEQALVSVVISDAHPGLKAALATVLGAPSQRRTVAQDPLDQPARALQPRNRPQDRRRRHLPRRRQPDPARLHARDRGQRRVVGRAQLHQPEVDGHSERSPTRAKSPSRPRQGSRTHRGMSRRRPRPRTQRRTPTPRPGT